MFVYHKSWYSLFSKKVLEFVMPEINSYIAMAQVESKINQFLS